MNDPLYAIKKNPCDKSKQVLTKPTSGKMTLFLQLIPLNKLVVFLLTLTEVNIGQANSWWLTLLTSPSLGCHGFLPG